MYRGRIWVRFGQTYYLERLKSFDLGWVEFMQFLAKSESNQPIKNELV